MFGNEQSTASQPILCSGLEHLDVLRPVQGTVLQKPRQSAPMIHLGTLTAHNMQSFYLLVADQQAAVRLL
jgi:hypothetical protein